MGLIREGVREGRLRDLPEPVLLSVLMGAISVPALMFTCLRMPERFFRKEHVRG